MNPHYQRFIALGDSFTEGLNDDIAANGRHIGWADRAAAALAERNPKMQYANLAVRGRLMQQVLDEQVPQALALQPDLVSIAAGVNDALRSSFDLPATAAALEEAVAAVAQAGAKPVIFGFGDPSRRSQVLGRIHSRFRDYRTASLEIAERHDAMVVDFWDCAVFDDDQLWSFDRLHLSPRGHQIAALAFLDAIGVGTDAWRTPQVAPPPAPWLSRRYADARWLKEFAGPWVSRRVRGVSSGDGVSPKYPDWITPTVGRPQG